MKILVIGLGQCGGRIADEFSRLNSRAKRERGLHILSGVYAVSTDTADLIDLTSIKPDFHHRILIAAEELKGLGVQGDNELGARVMQDHADFVIEEIRMAREFYETDAILVIAGAAGGIGSGALPVMVQRLKQRFLDKIVHAMVILPFKHEEAEETRTVLNTAVSLKSVTSVADAVFLVDNEAYSASLGMEAFAEINPAIVEPFYNLLCAGEEKHKQYIGAKLMDAGDIIQTLKGWTSVGMGRVSLPSGLGGMFKKKSYDTSKGIRAMDEAIGEASRLGKAEDAASALYLITAPSGEMNVGLIKSLGDYIKQAAPNAIIRSGDYPAGSGAIAVTVILSALRDVARVREFYSRPGDEKSIP